MSHNQSRVEKTEGHLRRPGRTGNVGKNKGFVGGCKGGGPSATAPVFSPSSTLPPSSVSHEFASNRSGKKSGNGQGEQARANLGNSNFDAGNRGVPNGAHTVTHQHGSSNGMESGNGKQVDAFGNKKISRAVPKIPAAQSAVATPGEECGPFLQFGTINPGIMNGMQVPARTCSAPPNLDEQKRDQARHGSVRVAPEIPLPSVPRPQQAVQKPSPQQPMLHQKQHQTMKDGGGFNQAGSRESHPPTHLKRDIHVPIPSIPGAPSARSSVLSAGGIPMHGPFQQSQIPVQFSGPNMQIPSQGIVPSSLQMTMNLPSGNVPQVPQQMFVPNIQSHPSAIMHQGQSLGFTPQLGHQLPPQLGSLGVGITPQFHQQQPGNFVSQRKAVKITHPDTHEELKLDKRSNLQTDPNASGQRQLPNATSQSQPLPAFNQQLSYYPPAYSHSPMFFPSSLPLQGTQMTTGPQATRYGYPIGQNGQTISFMNPSALNSAISGRSGLPPPLHGLPEAVNSDVSSVSSSLAASAQVTVKPAILSAPEKVVTPAVRISMPITKPELQKQSKLSGNVPVSSQLKDKEFVPQNTSTIQKKSYEATGTDSSSSHNDKNLAKVSSMVSAHINKSEAFLAPTIVASSASVVADDDGRKEESLRSGSPNDHQRSSSKRDLKHFHQEVNALEDTGSLIIHPSTTVVDNNLTFDIGHSPSNDSASIHSAPAIDSSILASSLHSTTSESQAFELDQNKDIAGALDSSIATVKDEPSETVGSSPDPVEVAGDRISSEDAGHLETSTSRSDAHETTLETSGVSHVSSKTLEVAQIQETLPESESVNAEVSGDHLLSSSSAMPLSMIENSDEVAEILNLEEETKTGSQLGVSVDPQLSSVEEDGDQSILRASTVSDVPISTLCDKNDTELSSYEQASLTDAVDDKILATDSKIHKNEEHSENVNASENGSSLLEITPMLSGSEIKLKPGVKSVELSTSIQTPSVLSGLPDKSPLEPSITKTNRKKKKREILSKADAAGSSDLYNAYKGPDQKLDTIRTSENILSSSIADSKNNSVEDHTDAEMAVEVDEQLKSEVEDWEDAADASTPKLRSDNDELVDVEKKMQFECEYESTGKKKYSRDFLLTFSEQCKDLPLGFDVGSDITNIILRAQVGVTRGFDRDGRIGDRSPGISRGDRHVVGGISEVDRWMKGSNNFRADLGYGVAAMNVHPVQGVNQGVLRFPRIPSQLSGGILSGLIQSGISQGGIARNISDADRWQRGASNQRGLMPPPQGSMQVFHKSANRYEVGKVSDEEQQKQRQLKAILNKLTPQNFDKLFAKVKEVNIDNTVTLTGVISQIFDKALMEPTFCEMYADFCSHLAVELPDFFEENEKVNFRRLLLNKCQEEFERGEREEAEAEKVEEEGEIHHTEAEREEKRIKARRRMLGNIRLIGELFKKKMLTEGIMHGCIQQLLGPHQNPDEENIEALCKLMSTIGEMIDHSKAREHMDTYFEMMTQLSVNQKLSSRVRFMLKDTIDLRKNKWQQRRKVEGPKKIDDVHRDAAQERQAQTTRLARGPVISSKRGPPVEYGHRGPSILNSSSSQMSGTIRSLPGQNRGLNSQDVRLDSRVPSSVPLPQRVTDVGSITLGPQGGLAKGMSGRGQGLVSNVPLTEISLRSVDSHRSGSGPNGFSSTHDRIPLYSREESSLKNLDRSSVASNDQISSQDRNSVVGIRDTRHVDRAFDKPGAATTGRRPGSAGGRSSASEPKVLSEETLRQKSMSAIREFYR